MAPETDYNHETKGDALHSMEIALALVSLPSCDAPTHLQLMLLAVSSPSRLLI